MKKFSPTAITTLVFAITTAYSAQTQAAGPALPFVLGLGGGVVVDQMNGPTTNVGAIDYAVAPTSADGAKGRCTSLIQKFDPTNGNQVVAKDEIYEVILKHIKLGSDASKNLTSIADAIAGHIQIAVVANGFEMSSSSSGSKGFDFSPSSANAGRVVYYSDDVKASQVLNFGQLTMFGPVKYEGNPVAISLYAFKIANDTGAKMAPMLSSLASMGKNVVSPDILGVLETLGTQLLKGQDVRVFRYDTMLRAKDGNSIPNLATANLVYGDYVLVRQEDRNKPINWSDYRYDHVSGKLYRGTACDNEVADISYGVIQVAKGSEIAYMQYASYGDFRKSIANAAINGDPTAAAKATENYIQAQMYNRALATIELLGTSKTKPPTDQKIELQTLLKNIRASIDAKSSNTLDPTQHFSENTVDKLLLIIADATEKAAYTKTNFNAETAYADFSTLWKKTTTGALFAVGP